MSEIIQNRFASSGGVPMPEISRFYGIVIRMYHRDHERPHFHVDYAEWKASLDVRSLKILQGELPARVHGMVVEWAGQHRAELLLNWRRESRRWSRCHGRSE